MRLFSLLTLGFILVNCSSHPEIPFDDSLFAAQEPIASLGTKKAEEASGLIASSLNPDILWTHNDSGGKPELYAFDLRGNLRLTLKLTDALNEDWEELAFDESTSTIYIADIGDNRAERENLTIYKVKEPALDSSIDKVQTRAYETMTIQYGNGARDAETIMFDPDSRNLILVSKREDECFVYEFSFEVGHKVLKPIGTIPFTLLTSGDINSKGEVLLKTYDDIMFWKTSRKSAAQRILQNPDARIPYVPEAQGEAIAWSKGGFFTLSELSDQKEQVIYFFESK